MWGGLTCSLFAAIQVEEVNSWAESHPKAQVEDFLDWVKKTDPEQLSWFTLMKKSQSAQGASSLNPRVVVFGPESKFIFTFNGESSQAGFHEVEMIFFTEKPEARWELRKLSFEKAGKTTFSEPNPKTCLACHQNPVRPIWAQYDIWEGAYGENDDSIPDFDHDKYAIVSFSDSILEKRKKEFQEFTTFRNHSETHSRYSKLQFPSGSPVSPYAPSGRYSDYRFRPNLKLTESLSKLHVKTLVAKLKNHPQFEKEKKFLLAMLLHCDEREDQKDFKSLIQELEKAFSNSSKTVRDWNRRGYVGSDSRRNYLLYLLGLEHSDFSLEKNPEYWAYFEGSLYSDESLMMELYTEIKKTDSSLPPLAYMNGYAYEYTVPAGDPGEKIHLSEACELLLKSRVASGKIEASGPEKLPNSIETCLGCHSVGGSGPYIPFEDRESLSRNKKLMDEILIRISEERDSTKKMPPTRSLSQKETEGIREWLLRLQKNR